MTEINDELDCCGINEIRDINEYKHEPKLIIEGVCKEMYLTGKNGAFLIYSDTGKHTAGKNLTNYIRENNLGKVRESTVKRNPNTRRQLKMWIWEINHKILKKYWNQNKEKTIYDNGDENE